MNRIAIMASGSGSNAEALVKHFKGLQKARIVLILTDNPKAFVLERAAKLGVPSQQFSMEELGNGSVLSLLKDHNIDFIVLAGFLKLVPNNLLQAYPNRIVNIHPALLPKYGGKGMYGLRVHQAVIENGETESGISIHYINGKYDEGELIFQAKCPVLPNDTPESLAERIHTLEHKHFPEVVEGIVG